MAAAAKPGLFARKSVESLVPMMPPPRAVRSTTPTGRRSSVRSPSVSRTIFAFILVNVGVIVLRRTAPDAARGYRVPFVPVFPIIGAVLCLVLIFFLESPLTTLVRFVVWLAIGLVIYFAYGRNHSRLQRGETGAPQPEVA